MANLMRSAGSVPLLWVLALLTRVPSPSALQHATPSVPVTGLVTREDGSPVRGAVVAFSVVTWKGDAVPVVTECATTGEDGRFVLPAPPAEQVAQPVWVTAVADHLAAGS